MRVKLREPIMHTNHGHGPGLLCNFIRITWVCIVQTLFTKISTFSAATIDIDTRCTDVRPNKKLAGQTPIKQESDVNSIGNCKKLCESNATCKAVDYKKDEKICRLYGDDLKLSDTEDDNDYQTVFCVYGDEGKCMITLKTLTNVGCNTSLWKSTVFTVLGPTRRVLHYAFWQILHMLLIVEM